MKPIIILLICFLSFCSCSVTVYDDINDYKGAVILNIKPDSVGITDKEVAYKLLIKNKNNKVQTILVENMIGETLKINDTIE